MAGRIVPNQAAEPNPQLSLKAREIRSSDTVAAVLESEPGLLDVFLTAGFTHLSSPYARQTVARVVTLEQACRRTGRDIQPFLTDLNQARDRLRLPLVQITGPQSDQYQGPTSDQTQATPTTESCLKC